MRYEVDYGHGVPPQKTRCGQQQRQRRQPRGAPRQRRRTAPTPGRPKPTMPAKSAKRTTPATAGRRGEGEEASRRRSATTASDARKATTGQRAATAPAAGPPRPARRLARGDRRRGRHRRRRRCCCRAPRPRRSSWTAARRSARLPRRPARPRSRAPLASGAAALVAGLVVDALLKGGITVTGGSHRLAPRPSAPSPSSPCSASWERGSGPSTRPPSRRSRHCGSSTSPRVAEAAQRAVLGGSETGRPARGSGSIYLAAAAEARVGGDLYEVVATTSTESG